MIGSVINGFFETGKQFIHFGFSDDQRRTAGNDIPGKGPQDQAVLLGLCDQMGPDFLGRIKKLLFLFIANEFESTDQSEASGSSNHGMFLQFPARLGKTGCQVTDSRNQVTFFIYFQRFQSHSGRYRMPAVGITVAEHAVSGTLFTHHLIDRI